MTAYSFPSTSLFHQLSLVDTFLLSVYPNTAERTGTEESGELRKIQLVWTSLSCSFSDCKYELD